LKPLYKIYTFILGNYWDFGFSWDFEFWYVFGFSFYFQPSYHVTSVTERIHHSLSDQSTIQAKIEVTALTAGERRHNTISTGCH
jgi:hypothetical protein